MWVTGVQTCALPIWSSSKELPSSVPRSKKLQWTPWLRIDQAEILPNTSNAVVGEVLAHADVFNLSWKFSWFIRSLIWDRNYVCNGCAVYCEFSCVGAASSLGCYRQIEVRAACLDDHSFILQNLANVILASPFENWSWGGVLVRCCDPCVRCTASLVRDGDWLQRSRSTAPLQLVNLHFFFGYRNAGYRSHKRLGNWMEVVRPRRAENRGKTGRENRNRLNTRGGSWWRKKG